VNKQILAGSGVLVQAPRLSPLTRDKKVEPVPGTSTRFERWRFWCPYGQWTCADGRRVLFNRDYVPIYQRKRGVTSVADHTEYVPWVNQRWFFNDGNSPAGFGRGIPTWKWRPVVERINKILWMWGLPPLPPRPPQRASSPARLRQRAWAEYEAAIKAAKAAEPVMASAADWREIEERIVSPLSARAIDNKHKIGPGKLRNYIFFGEPKVGERSDVHYWMARCLLERGLPPSEAYVLLRDTNWNKHKYENEYRWEEMTWCVIEKAWSKPFVLWSEQQKRGKP
jgi:hypothetical protein